MGREIEVRRHTDADGDVRRADRFVGHSPTNEAAILGLTGKIVGPLAKGDGALVIAGDDRYAVEPLE